ncbi:MAG: DUF58 domain-containing protein [Planctomycetes bacterium]|nr:DUF58 domain-containing protein [Planctomycetota bacterium]
MSPTSFGAKTVAFYAVVLGAYFASPYTNLFFLLVSFLTVVLLLNFGWTWKNVRRLSGTIHELPPVAANSLTECEVQLANGPHPSVNVEVDLVLGRKRHVIGRAAIVGADETIRCRLPRLGRGIHEITAARASSSYPLGVIRASRRLEVPRKLVVYPEPLAEDIVDPTGSLRRDDSGVDLAAQGSGRTETAGLRAYREGDSIRDVHWRASARSPDGLVIREFEPHADHAIDVVFDARCEGEQFELSLRAIARLALTAQDLDQPIYVRSQEIDEAFGAGRLPLPDLWKWLAIAAPCAPDTPPPQVAVGSDAIRLPAALDRFGEESR